MSKKISIAVLGVGTIGREFLNQSKNRKEYKIVSIADTTGVITKETGFTPSELEKIIQHKKSKNSLVSLKKEYYYSKNKEEIISSNPEIVVDVTASQTYSLLLKIAETSNIVTANKIPFSETSYEKYSKLLKKAEDSGHKIDLGTTAGAGLQAPNLLKLFPNGVSKITGCLSGTMNYISQRINEDTSLSQAIKEAMNPPRNYAEPDPRIDLAGRDFARKLVILARLTGKQLEIDEIQVQDIIPDHLKHISKEDFIEKLDDMNDSITKAIIAAKLNDNALWFIGTADLDNDKYSIGFEEVPNTDPITGSMESDNIIRYYPKNWRRPVTIVGPGAGAPETVSGIISGIVAILKD